MTEADKRHVPPAKIYEIIEAENNSYILQSDLADKHDLTWEQAGYVLEEFERLGVTQVQQDGRKLWVPPGNLQAIRRSLGLSDQYAASGHTGVTTLDSPLVSLPVSELNTDSPKYRLRQMLDEEAIESYRQTYENGGSMPPILVHEVHGVYYVADGHHRVKAARLADVEELPAYVRNGSLLDVLLEATGANTRHGVRFTTACKQKACRAILQLAESRSMTNTDIARAIGVSDNMVRKYRQEVQGVSSPQAHRTPRPRREVQAEPDIENFEIELPQGAPETSSPQASTPQEIERRNQQAIAAVEMRADELVQTLRRIQPGNLTTEQALRLHQTVENVTNNTRRLAEVVTPEPALSGGVA